MEDLTLYGSLCPLRKRKDFQVCLSIAEEAFDVCSSTIFDQSFLGRLVFIPTEYEETIFDLVPVLIQFWQFFPFSRVLLSPVPYQTLCLCLIHIDKSILRVPKQIDLDTLTKEGMVLIVEDVFSTVEMILALHIQFIALIAIGSRHPDEEGMLVFSTISTHDDTVVAIEHFKQFLSCIPSIQIIHLNIDIQGFLYIGCDRQECALIQDIGRNDLKPDRDMCLDIQNQNKA